MAARLPQPPEPATPDPAPLRTGWRSAWRALRRLIEDPERTDAVFDLIDALPDRSGERALRRLRADPQGRAVLARRPSLRDALADADALAALPEGSLGRAYARFLRAEGLRADALVEADEGRPRADARTDRPPQDRADPDEPALEWLGARMRDLHDLFHVLTGYGRDEAGEIANLAFTYAQLPSRGIGLIVLAGMARGPKSRGLAWQRYVLRAWRRGRRARPVAHAPVEDWLALPLDEVRRRLRIDPPERAHPGGIAVGPRFGPAGGGAR